MALSLAPGGNDYKAKVRSISFNLGKNDDLRSSVLVGDVEVEALCKMSTEEMATQKMRQLKEYLKEQTMLDVMVSVALPLQELQGDLECVALSCMPFVVQCKVLRLSVWAWLAGCRCS